MLSIKQLIAGIVLILVIGIAGFLYRNTMEKPNAGLPEQVACTMEAKLCPDGTSVSRQGPNCDFAACPVGNVEFAEAKVAFALPAGYVKGVQEPGADGFIEHMLDFYQKGSSSANAPHYITVYSYPIPNGKSADEVILENTRYQPADMQAEDFSKFTNVTIGGKTFRMTVIERFEGQVESAYFLARATDVLRFEIIERDVTGWTEPSLVIRDLPEHKSLEKLLATLQAGF